jgi:hypothetical protein
VALYTLPLWAILEGRLTVFLVRMEIVDGLGESAGRR